ncbi:hypothetical protein I4U23_003346 [Adineta vaga]|nr:hypothetical protein I4U23_003346 [Adineta vaga]
MLATIVVYLCRICSILLMYSGLIFGSFCTIFILYELYHRSELRTSTNILIITVFCSDCLRALICAIIETVVLAKTWNISIQNCRSGGYVIDHNDIAVNFCRTAMAVRSIFNVTQPFGFVAIAYERLRTLVKRNGNLNVNTIRLKNIFIWIGVTLFFGIIAGIYHAIAYSSSNTCYGQYDTASRIAMTIRLFFVISAAFISGLIYGKMFFALRKHRMNRVLPIIVGGNIGQQTNQINDTQKKDLHLAKQTFTIFLSFFLCRVPSIILVLLGLIITEQLSETNRCYLEEFTNLSIQFIFVATITDPLVYICTQSRLRQKFFQFPIISLCCVHPINE